MEPDRMSDELDPQLPPRLVQALKDLPGVEVSSTMDASVLLRARSAIARNRRRRRLLQWAGAAASLAAVIAVAVVVLHDRHPARPTPTVALREDLDGNGRVDILDAFWLARRIGNEPSQPPWDVNGDGKVDQQDIDAIAATAVHVGERS
jgi:hypothetical protein